MGNPTLNSHWSYKNSVYQDQAAAFAASQLKKSFKLPPVSLPPVSVPTVST
jgi:hypothetical protein